MRHGGDIYRNQVDLDYSVNLNPLGPPEEILGAVRDAVNRLTVYPDPLQESVRQALSDMESVSAEQVIAGSGASELLLAIVRALKPQQALLLEPAFTGYSHVLNAEGCRIRSLFLHSSNGFRLREQHIAGLFDCLEDSAGRESARQSLVILCNPANPTGMSMDEEILETILAQAHRREIPVLLDESFFLLSDEAEHAGRNRSRRLIEAYDHLFLVRSLTKILAVPGLRAGYVLSAPGNIRRVKAQLPEWNLSTPAEAAITAGCHLLEKTGFAADARSLIRKERDYLASKLREAGLTVYEGEAPYLLLHGRETLFQELLGRRILIRDCSDFPGLGRGWFRIAIKDHGSNEALIDEIRKLTDGSL